MKNSCIKLKKISSGGKLIIAKAKHLYTVAFLLVAFSPALATAQPGVMLNGSNGGFYGVVAVIKNAINVILPIIISLAVLYFLWGIFLYVKSSDSGKQEEAKEYIIWSLIFIAVMVSVWGLVNIITSTFNLDKRAPTPPPIPEYAE